VSGSPDSRQFAAMKGSGISGEEMARDKERCPGGLMTGDVANLERWDPLFCADEGSTNTG